MCRLRSVVGYDGVSTPKAQRGEGRRRVLHFASQPSLWAWLGPLLLFVASLTATAVTFFGILGSNNFCTHGYRSVRVSPVGDALPLTYRAYLALNERSITPCRCHSRLPD